MKGTRIYLMASGITFALITFLFLCCDLAAQNVGIGTTSPSANLHISPNSATFALRIDQGQNGEGIVCYVNTTSSNKRVFSAGSNKTGLTVLGDGNVGIGISDPEHRLEVVSNEQSYCASFKNTSPSSSASGVYAICNNAEGEGVGILGIGGTIGVSGSSASSYGSLGTRFGVRGSASDGYSNYGMYAKATGGSQAYGIYATATTATTNWAGYFQGNVYSTGIYQGSDRKLKKDIHALKDAMEIIERLQPSEYNYRTDDFSLMQLPEGIQYGLIADEVKQVIPGLVNKAVQPAEYENHDGATGKKISDEVEFEAVNYTALIPVLIGAMKEQQAVITSQQQKIDALVKETAELRRLMQK